MKVIIQNKSSAGFIVTHQIILTEPMPINFQNDRDKVWSDVATVCAAPAVLIGIAIYSVADYFFDIGGIIDRNVGRNSGYDYE